MCGGESCESNPFPASVPVVGEWRFSAGWTGGYLHESESESRLAPTSESRPERMKLIFSSFNELLQLEI